MKIIIILLLITITGCQEVTGSGFPVPFSAGYHFTTDRGLDCYYVSGSREGGLSCNWQKHNDELKACKESSLKRRTMKDGRIFPSIKGECDKLINRMDNQ